MRICSLLGPLGLLVLKWRWRKLELVVLKMVKVEDLSCVQIQGPTPSKCDLEWWLCHNVTKWTSILVDLRCASRVHLTYFYFYCLFFKDRRLSTKNCSLLATQQSNASTFFFLIISTLNGFFLNQFYHPMTYMLSHNPNIG